MKYRVIIETVIEIEAESEQAAAEEFYDGVYEVDRHGNYRIEPV